HASRQAYGHAILPLANQHGRETQVRWGMADFRYRFGREPEALWLPETACNDDVLGLLIDEGLRFVILAPQQAARVRKIGIGLPAPALARRPAGLHGWQTVDNNTIDPSIAYNYFH